MMAVDRSLEDTLAQSTQVNEFAETIKVPAAMVHKVLAALGEMDAQEATLLIGAEASIVKESTRRAINRATRKGACRHFGPNVVVNGTCSRCGSSVR